MGCHISSERQWWARAGFGALHLTLQEPNLFSWYITSSPRPLHLSLIMCSVTIYTTLQGWSFVQCPHICSGHLSLHMFWWSVHFDHNFNKCVLFFENIQRITHQRLFVSTHHKDQWGMAERYVKSLQIWKWRASNATDVLHSFFQAAWPPKKYFLVIWKGGSRQGIL